MDLCRSLLPILMLASLTRVQENFKANLSYYLHITKLLTCRGLLFPDEVELKQKQWRIICPFILHETWKPISESIWQINVTCVYISWQ
jgi:hypothetical protein